MSVLVGRVLVVAYARPLMVRVDWYTRRAFYRLSNEGFFRWPKPRIT